VIVKETGEEVCGNIPKIKANIYEKILRRKIKQMIQEIPAVVQSATRSDGGGLKSPLHKTNIEECVS
jgi:hypothetical protein